MNIDNYPRIEPSNLVPSGLICTIVCIMLINIAAHVSGELTDDLDSNILTSGKINDTVKKDNGNTIWLLSGSWKSNLFTNAVYNYTNPAKFSAKINMVLINGSSPHTHKISHFVLTNISTQEHSKVYEGYLAISMKLGPVFAIPVSIKNYQNETINISLNSLDDITSDQTEVIDHFESKPIFGMFGK
jgi:hypothetical protein